MPSSAYEIIVDWSSDVRSEERRVGKGVDLGGRRIIKKKKPSSYYWATTFLQTRQQSTSHAGMSSGAKDVGSDGRGRLQVEDTHERRSVFFFKQKTAYEIIV